MSKLVCHCCGASITPTASQQFVKCEFCDSSVSVVEFFQSVSTNTIKSLEDAGLDDNEQKKISRLFKNAEIYLDSKDFNKAKEIFEDILNIYPQHLESRLNSAICILYNKELDLVNKAELAHNYCTKTIEPHQITPEVDTILKKISYNICTLAQKETISEKKFEIFNYSKNIIESYDERDKIVNDYCEALLKSCNKQFESNINDRKDKYSPNTTYLNTLHTFSKIYPKFAELGLTVCLYMKDNKKNIHPRSLEMLSVLEKDFFDICKSKVKQYSFGFFGIKTAEVDYKLN